MSAIYRRGLKRCTGCDGIGHTRRNCDAKTTLEDLRWCIKERRHENQRRYRKSEIGRATQARYEATARARERKARYVKGEKRRAAQRKYNTSAKGRARKNAWQRKWRALLRDVDALMLPSEVTK